MDLRPYQISGIDHVRGLLAQGKTKVLAVSPTGSGKTVMFCDVLRRAAERSKRALVLAHRSELIEQTSEKLHRFETRHGIIQAQRPLQLQHAIQVASVQTLINRPGLLGQVDLIVIDEAHHFTTANSYARIIGWWPQAVVLGFTATPWRLDGAGLADLFDAHVVISTPRKLRDEGHLVPVVGFEYSAIDTAGVKVSKGDYVARELEAGAQKIYGDVVEQWKQHAGGVRSVLFACTVRHSEEMAAAFVRAGVPAEHLDGETPWLQRKAILRRLEAGETQVLCNVNVATEGWDLPALACAMLCRPTLSTSLALQMVGRVLRPSPGKAFARIHDHARVLSTHGHPYVERDWSPEKSSKVERKAAESNVKRGLRCLQCKAVIDKHPCPSCGFAPTPRELEMQREAAARALTDTPEFRKIRAQQEKQAQARASWQLKTASEKYFIFLGLARKLGFKPALGAFRRMSGESEWPSKEWKDQVLKEMSLVPRLAPAVYR